MNPQRLLRPGPATVGLVLTAVAVSLAGCAHSDYSRRDRGYRYSTLRALANDVAERAHDAADAAVAMTGRRDRDREFLDSITEFAREAEDFSRTVERRRYDDPDDLGDEFEDLRKRARRVSDRIREARVTDRVWDEWDEVVDAMQAMNRMMARYEGRDDRYGDRRR